MILNELCHDHPCMLRQIWNITCWARRTTWSYVIVRGCVRRRTVLWFSNGKGKRKARERKWNTTNQPYWPLLDTCFNGILDYEVVIVETSLNTILPARCNLALINSELARTITSCLVCFNSLNGLKWKWTYPFHLESIFISAWPVLDLISTKDFNFSFSRSVFAHYLS